MRNREKRKNANSISKVEMVLVIIETILTLYNSVHFWALCYIVFFQW